MIKHLNEETFQCRQCYITFLDIRNLKYHMATQVGKKLYQCSLCEESYSRNYSLKTHKEKHSNKEITNNR